MKPPMTSSNAGRGTGCRDLCWQGWRFSLPADWGPVKIEGDRRAGSMIIADLHDSRLAVRWSTPRKKYFDAAAWAMQAMTGEVGKLAADASRTFAPGGAWTVGRLFVEPEPPGRDVWVGHSIVSGRLMQISYPSKKVSSALAADVLAHLLDQPADQPMRWAIFDLQCAAPGGFNLLTHRLNAGDLALTFSSGREQLTVRQIGPASVALQRQPLEAWARGHGRVWQKTHRPNIGPPSAAGEDSPTIVQQTLSRKRRWFLARQLSPNRYITAVHQVERNRILILDAASPQRVEEARAGVDAAIGTAPREVRP